MLGIIGSTIPGPSGRCSSELTKGIGIIDGWVIGTIGLKPVLVIDGFIGALHSVQGNDAVDEVLTSKG